MRRAGGASRLTRDHHACMLPRMAEWKRLPQVDVVQVCARSGCDARTVRRRLEGRPMKTRTRRLVEEAVVALGFSEYLAENQDAPPPARGEEGT